MLLDDVRQDLHQAHDASKDGKQDKSFVPNARREAFVLEVLEAFGKTDRSDRNAAVMALVLYEAGRCAGSSEAHVEIMESIDEIVVARGATGKGGEA